MHSAFKVTNVNISRYLVSGVWLVEQC